jgi:transposase InsO family protein
VPHKAGDLVQSDTIHLMTSPKTRIYVFSLIDVYSRWVYAEGFESMNAKTSVDFVQCAQQHAQFRFNMMQSDHGSEFGKWFVKRMQKPHRYTRVGKPNDNAHIERFNRTIQEECLDKVSRKVEVINQSLPECYNSKRLHLGISLKTPVQLV